MSASRNRRFIRHLGLLAAFALLGASPGWGETLQEVMKKRGLSQQDVLAAAKTYVPTGKRDGKSVFTLEHLIR